MFDGLSGVTALCIDFSAVVSEVSYTFHPVKRLLCKYNRTQKKHRVHKICNTYFYAWPRIMDIKL